MQIPIHPRCRLLEDHSGFHAFQDILDEVAVSRPDKCPVDPDLPCMVHRQVLRLRIHKLLSEKAKQIQEQVSGGVEAGEKTERGGEAPKRVILSQTLQPYVLVANATDRCLPEQKRTGAYGGESSQARTHPTEKLRHTGCAAGEQRALKTSRSEECQTGTEVERPPGLKRARDVVEVYETDDIGVEVDRANISGNASNSNFPQPAGSSIVFHCGKVARTAEVDGLGVQQLLCQSDEDRTAATEPEKQGAWTKHREREFSVSQVCPREDDKEDSILPSGPTVGRPETEGSEDDQFSEHAQLVELYRSCQAQATQEAFEDMCDLVGADVLRSFVHALFEHRPDELFVFTKRFTQCTGVVSLLNYVLSMVDINPRKIMLNVDDGVVTQLEMKPYYNPSSFALDSAEHVPFRLTCNVQTLIGPFGRLGVLPAVMYALTHCLDKFRDCFGSALCMLMRDDVSALGQQRDRVLQHQRLFRRGRAHSGSTFKTQRALAVSEKADEGGDCPRGLGARSVFGGGRETNSRISPIQHTLQAHLRTLTETNVLQVQNTLKRLKGSRQGSGDAGCTGRGAASDDSVKDEPKAPEPAITEEVSRLLHCAVDRDQLALAKPSWQPWF